MDKKKLGYYAGYLLSAFYLGQLPGSVFWGWLADKCGRKKPLMVIVFCSRFPPISSLVDAICVLSFAFLQNYYVAVAVRFVWGFLDGHYPLVKTLATDYSTEENVALHTSFLFVSVSFGKWFCCHSLISSAIAPLLGGYFSDPEHISDWLLRLFPILRTKQFCLPFLICGLLLFLCFPSPLPQPQVSSSSSSLSRRRRMTRTPSSPTLHRLFLSSTPGSFWPLFSMVLPLSLPHAQASRLSCSAPTTRSSLSGSPPTARWAASAGTRSASATISASSAPCRR